MTARNKKLDKFDRKILVELQRNGRLSVKELAEKVSLSHTPCLRRVAILEKEGFIERYKAVVNFKRAGLAIRAFALLRRRRDSNLDVWNKIAELDEVVSCCLVSGENDMMAEIYAEDMDHYTSILLNKITIIDGVDDARTMFVMKDLKSDGVINLMALAES
ncbi:Lrp/AsnC family transcriptional regulator [bacterium M00.F.Ca.ET.194.01.1.1]|nr:Lrp/AsnC family transcriptional regulator [bacterium M00.F.Ca.ET.194.01.1.1]TGS52325.1 Lrp/AsnC family transcriptional regulator [bacterium M00.F.Ca.ET.179.01.1.1]TGV44186.1 Lrp/AsnC family transcriptional regulator [bacterium M00.F.Ca.ET.168.01.1.1]